MTDEQLRQEFEYLIDRLKSIQRQEKFIDDDSKVMLCLSEPRFQLFGGIDYLAEVLGEHTEDFERHDEFSPFRRVFSHRGIQFVQISEKDGTFRGAKA